MSLGRLRIASDSYTRPANTTAYAAGDAITAPALTITAASNATPIVITSTAHGLVTGDAVTVAAVGGNTAANGNWLVTKIDANTFSLDGSVGNGAYTSGGTAVRMLRFQSIVGANIQGGRLIKARVVTNNATVTNGTLRLYLFNAPATIIVDNGAWTFLYADRSPLLGKSADLVLATEGSGSDCAGAQDVASAIPFGLPAGSRDIFGILVAEAAYVPASGQTVFVEIGVES